MAIAGAIKRNDRDPYSLPQSNIPEPFSIGLEAFETIAYQGLCLLDLSVEHRRNQLPRQIGRANVEPSALVDRVAQELAPVHPLLPDHLSSLEEAAVTDNPRAPSPATMFLVSRKLKAPTLDRVSASRPL